MPVQDITAKSLEMLDKTEDFVLDTATDAAEALSEYIPDVDVPVGDGLRKASEIVDELFVFAGDVVASQRDFFGKLIAVAQDNLVPAPKPTKTTKTTKTTAA